MTVNQRNNPIPINYLEHSTPTSPESGAAQGPLATAVAVRALGGRSDNLADDAAHSIKFADSAADVYQIKALIGNLKRDPTIEGLQEARSILQEAQTKAADLNRGVSREVILSKLTHLEAKLGKIEKRTCHIESVIELLDARFELLKSLEGLKKMPTTENIGAIRSMLKEARTRACELNSDPKTPRLKKLFIATFEQIKIEIRTIESELRIKETKTLEDIAVAGLCDDLGRMETILEDAAEDLPAQALLSDASTFEDYDARFKSHFGICDRCPRGAPITVQLRDNVIEKQTQSNLRDSDKRAMDDLDRIKGQIGEDSERGAMWTIDTLKCRGDNIAHVIQSNLMSRQNITPDERHALLCCLHQGVNAHSYAYLMEQFAARELDRPICLRAVKAENGSIFSIDVDTEAKTFIISTNYQLEKSDIDRTVYAHIESTTTISFDSAKKDYGIAQLSYRAAILAPQRTGPLSRLTQFFKH